MGRAGEVGWLCERDLRCSGQAGEFSTFVASAMEIWERHFPRRSGYVILAEPLKESEAGGQQAGVRMSAIRGEFRADLDLHHETRSPMPGRALVACSSDDAIRLHASAASLRVSSLASFGEHLSSWGRGAMTLSPVALLLGSAWMVLGVQNPVLLGMGLALLFAFATVGGIAGEHLAKRGKAEALKDMSGDADSSMDMQRWRAACRQLSKQRNQLGASSSGQPFRIEAKKPNQDPGSKRNAKLRGRGRRHS